MIIDFHTHVFPDKIASKTIDLLAAKAGISPFSDGTIKGLLSELERAEVDIAVTLPVLTDPAQFDSVNRFSAEINRTFAGLPRRLISFGGIHPACEDIDEKMSFLRENGFLGVKIHPDYQGTFINDERYVRILESAKKYDLIVVTHAGVDVGYRDMPVRCTPDRVLDLIHKVPHGKFILAHYGANELWDEVEEKLCGENVYFDTAYILRYIGEDAFKRILQKHGEDQILFASDSPWSNIKGDVELLRSFSLPERTEKKIFCENAKRLLGI